MSARRLSDEELDRWVREYQQRTKLYADHPRVRCNREGEGYVYVLGFGSGIVKVGYTRDPVGRPRTHQATAEAFGDSLVSQWMSPPHLKYHANEAALIRFCADRAEGATGKEFFRIPFATVKTFAESLPFFSFVELGVYGLSDRATVGEVKAAFDEYASITEQLHERLASLKDEVARARSDGQRAA